MKNSKATTLPPQIDLVYTWVDGNDPEWQKRHNAAVGATQSASATNCAGRYADNDELRYSLRSVERYAPWIRRIFIVTDRQTPPWLDTSNPKIRIVDHSEILPPEALPTFNSVVIEHALHRIPGLAEHFLYANDDMFFNREVSPSDFFTPEGLPIIRFNRRPFRKLTLWLKEHILHDPISNYNNTIRNAARLVERRFGRYIGGKTHHNIDAYRKSQYRHAFELFEKEITPTLQHHSRHPDDIQRNLYSYVPVAKGRCRLHYVGRDTSFRLHIHRHDHYQKLEKHNPMLFCVNDSQYACDDDRILLRSFLERRFPDKSGFEIV